MTGSEATTNGIQAFRPVERVHIVVLLVSGVRRGTLDALAYARALRPERLVAVHVASDEADAAAVRRRWERAGAGVDLTVVVDHYRSLPAAVRTGHEDHQRRRRP